MSNCSQFLELLFDYIDDEFTDNVLVISVFEYIPFAEDRTELEKVFGPKAKKKYFNRLELNLSKYFLLIVKIIF